jgi:hypothetical protein
MFRRSWLVAVLVLSVLALPASAQVTMQWKFSEGDKFFVEEVADMKMTISLMGKDIKQEQKTTQVSSYTVKKKTADSVVLVQKIEGVDVKVQGGFGGEMDKFMEKLKGASFTVTLSNDGKVTKFEGYDEFVKNLAAGDENVGKLLKMMINEETLKKSSEEVFAFLPSKAVSKGDSWKRDAVLPLGPFGSFKTASDYTYEGKETDGEKISYKASMTYMAPKGDDGFGLFKIVKGNLKTEGAKGNMIFDAEKGRLVRTNMASTIRGSLTMDVMGNQFDMDMMMEMSGTARVLNKNPMGN